MLIPRRDKVETLEKTKVMQFILQLALNPDVISHQSYRSLKESQFCGKNQMAILI